MQCPGSPHTVLSFQFYKTVVLQMSSSCVSLLIHTGLLCIEVNMHEPVSASR